MAGDRLMAESFAEKLAYWRAHGLQVAASGIRPSARETYDRAAGTREVRDETGTSVIHHRDDDDRQDVVHRPATVRYRLDSAGRLERQ